MTKEHLKSLSAFLLLLGLPCGFMQAMPGVEAVKSQVVQQQTTCEGFVTDRDGESIIGASVVVKGTTNDTITGLDGEFNLSNH